MNFKKRFSAVFQTLVAAGIIAALVVACGGGSTSAPATGFVQSYTSTAGVGEVIQFGVDTANMKYTYSVNYTSYAASGVVAGQSGSGSLLSRNPGGSYNVGPSSDGFIQSGKVLPIQNGLLVGHVQLSIFGAARIPVFGVSNPITTVAGLAGIYNYQGFSCASLGIANVFGNPACLSHGGTVSVAAGGAYNVCKGGDINNQGVNPCIAAASGVINALPMPGVFDYRNAANGHIGYFFAFTAPNGQKVAVIDHDDSISIPQAYGHTVLATYASAVSGAYDGKYFVKNNEGGESLLSVSGTTLADTTFLGTVNGSMALNSPWPGLDAYSFSSGVLAASGVAMTAGTGVYTYRDNADSAVFGVGIRYSP